MATGSNLFTSHEAKKLVNTYGSSTLPVYINGGVPTSISSYEGNSTTATKLASAGTTGQFWRGDNSWSNILTGNLCLNAASGNSPALMFTRDSGLTDWQIFVTSGKLSFRSATDASTWTERAYFKDNSGDLVVNKLDIGGTDTAYKLYVNGSSQFNGHVMIGGSSLNLTHGGTWLGLYYTDSSEPESGLVNIRGSGRYGLAAHMSYTDGNAINALNYTGWYKNASNAYSVTPSALILGDTELYYYKATSKIYSKNEKISPSEYIVLHSGNYNNYAPTKTGTGASGTWGISISGNAANAVVLNSSIRVATTGSFDTKNVSPTWRRVALLKGSHTGHSFLVVLYSSYNSPHDHTSTFMIHCGYNEAMITCLGNSGSLAQFSQARLVRAAANTSDYYLDFYYCGNSQYANQPVAKIISFDNTTITTYAFTAASDGTVDASCILKSKSIVANSVYGAVWNDYAEYRQSDIEISPGHIVQDNDNGTMTLADARLIPGAQVVSDTFGFAIGETDESKTPIAVSGRALVYTYQDRYNYHAGMAVCSAPGGTVDIMTREEIKEYPDCIIGIVSEIPEYETWGSGNVAVDGRIWIKVR